jgi:hypothetical protein
MDRRGGSRFGCTVLLLLFAAVVYAGFTLGPPWLRYQQYRDEMRTNARFAVTLPDSVIRSRLLERADSLRLPKAARQIVIRHTVRPDMIRISAEYDEYVDFIFLGRKKLHFHPSVEEPL